MAATTGRYRELGYIRHHKCRIRYPAYPLLWGLGVRSFDPRSGARVPVRLFAIGLRSSANEFTRQAGDAMTCPKSNMHTILMIA